MDYQWPQSHAEQTDVLRPVAPPAAVPVLTGDEPTVKIERPKGPRAGRPGLRRAGIVAGAVLGTLAVLYTLDLIISSGDVPRGVTVAGVAVGGDSRADAEQKLRDAIGPRTTAPVDVKIGDVDTKVDPVKAGLTVDWQGTLDRAGDQPLNPFTRLASFFTTHEVGVATTTDNTALTAAVEVLRNNSDREPAEGGVKFDGIKPVAVEPKDGQQLDATGARQALIDDWATGDAVVLPVDTTPVKTTSEAVHKAIDEIAKPAVSGPVVVHGNGKDGRLEPPAIAKALTFAPDGKGGLTPKIDQKKVVGAVGPQLASTEIAGKDAQIVFTGGSPTVKPSVDGKGIDWKKSLQPLPDVLKKTDGRELTASYKHKPAKVTTAAANKLGIKEVIGEFTTSGFASDSGVNIRTVAAEVDGAIVKPGDTFSLNGYTGPRTAAQGYVEAGVIENGVPNREVGGGISQFATTLYNAAYFAAMTDAGHKEHSYYISRYPAAREATVFQNPDGSSVIDLKFTNESPTGVAIQTIWTSSSITVKIWGTKHYEVESITGGRGDYTEPETKTSTDPNCRPSEGGQGFTTSDTRIIKDANSGAEVSRKTRTVRYNSHPKIVCKPKPAR
ncbi:MAG TPA: VanW family protein [Actinophytocola sp.]|uniref:VanW family protein n=1 Tax=Actinophytocola sp. TaxID=1872138 RepID=UPI002F939D57